MAVAWVLRHAGMTSTVFGASRPEQVAENVAALAKLQFTSDELARIDELTA
jgi:L-glyceraldehyde 3-phosphate reductase